MAKSGALHREYNRGGTKLKTPNSSSEQRRSGKRATPEESPSPLDVDFQTCVYGDTRAKWTRLRCSNARLSRLSAVCPGESSSHIHEKWQGQKWGVRKVKGQWQFATKGAAEYTDTLCKKLLELLEPDEPPCERWVIELCCGSANLSFHAKARGFKVYPVDHKDNEHKPKVQQQTFDLTDEANWEKLFMFLEEKVEVIALILIAVPCGTYSRAREIPLPFWMRSSGAPQPKPLRDATHLLGLPGLHGVSF